MKHVAKTCLWKRIRKKICRFKKNEITVVKDFATSDKNALLIKCTNVRETNVHMIYRYALSNRCYKSIELIPYILAI